jgi:hypothetical protein
MSTLKITSVDQLLLEKPTVGKLANKLFLFYESVNLTFYYRVN